MSNTTTANKQDEKSLCKMGCGFFGSCATGGCCSQCFMVEMKNKEEPTISPVNSPVSAAVSAATKKPANANPAKVVVVNVHDNGTDNAATVAAVYTTATISLSTKKRQRQDEEVQAGAKPAAVPGQSKKNEPAQATIPPPVASSAEASSELPKKKKKRVAASPNKRGYKNMLATMMKASGRKTTEIERENLRKTLGGGAFEKVAKI